MITLEIRVNRTLHVRIMRTLHFVQYGRSQLKLFCCSRTSRQQRCLFVHYVHLPITAFIIPLSQETLPNEQT